MIRAVLFDWGNTLCAWEFDPELFVEGHRRGLAALGDTAPPQPSFTAAYSERVLPRLLDDGEDELDYASEIAALLATFGFEPRDGGVMRFLAAEQSVWRPAHRLEASVAELIDELRARGLKVGLVSNLFDPPELIRELLAEIGLLERLDAVAVSAEVGKRKPHRAIFEAALREIDVPAHEVLMVGDRLREDVGGAQALGMATVQALWFTTDDSGAAVPDATAATPADVLRFLRTS